jgi:hypothetical protein
MSSTPVFAACNFLLVIVWILFCLVLKRFKKIPFFAVRRHLRAVLELQRDLLRFHRERRGHGEKRLALGRRDGDAHSTKLSFLFILPIVAELMGWRPHTTSHKRQIVQ